MTGRLRKTMLAALLAVLPVGPSTMAGTEGDTSQADADAIRSCIGDAWPGDVRALCGGVVSAPCQLAERNGSTAGMGRCLTREAAAWDAVMQRQFAELMRRAGEVDAASGTPAGPDTAAAALETAQRAWLTYRDSECRYAYASWGKGGFRTVAHAACLVDLTARRVVDFHARLVTGG